MAIEESIINLSRKIDAFSKPSNATKLPDQYNLIAVFGLFGKGKTIFLTYFAVEQELTAKFYFNRDFKYEQIYANYNLYGVPNFIYLPPSLTKEELFKTIKPRSLLLIDEGDEYFSNREGTGKENRDRLKFFNQIRKKDTDVIINIPSIYWLDLRLRRDVVNYVFEAMGEQLYRGSGMFMYRFMQKIRIRDKIFFTPGGTFLADFRHVREHYQHKELIIK